MEEPLIYTSKGNLPISSLEYQTEWQDSPVSMVFIEAYRLNGEVVKRSVHAYSKTGITAEAIANDLG